MKIITIGDPHFKINNIREIQDFTEKFFCYLESIIKPDLIVVLGDILHNHERVNIQVMNRAQEFIKKLSEISLTYIIVGNHDMANPSVFLTKDHWMNAMKDWDNIVIVDKPIIFNIKGYIFTFIPYVLPGLFSKALDQLDEEIWKNSSTIFCHQEFQGSKMGAIVSETGDKWPSDYPFICSGHIHENQIIGENIYYPGSALQHSFSTRSPCISLLEYTKFTTTPTITEKDLKLNKKIIITKNFDDFNFKEFQIECAKKPPNISIRLNLSGTNSQLKSFTKNNYHKVMGIHNVNYIKLKNIDDVLFDTVSHDSNKTFIDTLHDEIRKSPNSIILLNLLNNLSN